MRIIHIVEANSENLEWEVKHCLEGLTQDDYFSTSYSSCFNGTSVEYSALIIIKEKGVF